MKPTVLMLFLTMCLSSAAAMRSSFCVVLNTQRFFASSGSTTDDVPTVAISGTFASAMTSRMAKAFGVVDGPISASMWFSSTSFLTFCTARVVSPPSSSWMYSIVASPIFFGSRSPVFFWGIPIADVGPVAETMRPIFTCPTANMDQQTAMAATTRRTGTKDSWRKASEALHAMPNTRSGTSRA